VEEDDDEWHPKLAALHAKFRADEERYVVKEAVTEEHDNGDLDFSDDGPCPEEKATEQRATYINWQGEGDRPTYEWAQGTTLV
jgi:hypothetical protein